MRNQVLEISTALCCHGIIVIIIIHNYYTWKMLIQTKTVDHGTSNSLFPTYLQEFLWRGKFEEEDTFNTILDHIAEQYPLP